MKVKPRSEVPTAPVGAASPTSNTNAAIEGMQGGLERMTAYARLAPAPPDALGPDAIHIDIVVTSLKLQERDRPVAKGLLSMSDQSLAIKLSAVHPEALRSMFARGGPSPEELASLSQLTMESYKAHGTYESFSRVDAILAGRVADGFERQPAAPSGSTEPARKEETAPLQSPAADSLWK